jgi:type IV pilus assembly protein PilN
VASQGGQLTITGMAESNNRVSNLMRNLDGSPLFVEPNLSSVKAEARNNETWSAFQLSVKQGAPKPDVKQEG